MGTEREKRKNKIKKKKKRKGARSATLGAADFSAIFNDRARSSSRKKDDDYYQRAKQELKKKGPRDIGKNKNYKGIKIKKKRKKKRKSSMDGSSDVEPKLGP